MLIELPDQFGPAIRMQANAHGVSPDGYVLEVLKRDLAAVLEGQTATVPFKTGRGILAQYGPAPSAEDIDSNRAEMFQTFDEHF